MSRNLIEGEWKRKIYVYKAMMWWIQLTQGMVCLGEIVYVEDTNTVVITVREVI